MLCRKSKPKVHFIAPWGKPPIPEGGNTLLLYTLCAEGGLPRHPNRHQSIYISLKKREWNKVTKVPMGFREMELETRKHYFVHYKGISTSSLRETGMGENLYVDSVTHEKC